MSGPVPEVPLELPVLVWFLWGIAMGHTAEMNLIERLARRGIIGNGKLQANVFGFMSHPRFH